MNMLQPDVQSIASLETLRVIIDTQRHQIVRLLQRRPQTARELALELGIARTRLYYHLGLLERHGVIYVVSERLVSGIPERTYAACARSFRIDRRLLEAQDSKTSVDGARAEVLERTAEDLRKRGESHRKSTELDEHTLVARTFVKLGNARLRALRAELTNIVREYEDAPEDPDARVAELAIAFFTLGQGYVSGVERTE
jgi:predicted ArsR family transcriptional regulator